MIMYEVREQCLTAFFPSTITIVQLFLPCMYILPSKLLVYIIIVSCLAILGTKVAERFPSSHEALRAVCRADCGGLQCRADMKGPDGRGIYPLGGDDGARREEFATTPTFR